GEVRLQCLAVMFPRLNRDACRPNAIVYPAVHASRRAGSAMTGGDGEGSGHIERLRRAAPSQTSDGPAPVREEASATSDVTTFAGAGSAQPLGQALRTLAGARGLPPQWILS